MRRSIFNRYLRDQTAAIGPLYALVIPALVVMGAIGFDYGRLMALDTELQNAADQAALAAATQLDGGDDAMIRARDAANNTLANSASQFVNETRFANDGQGRPITSLSFEFYDGYANDAFGNLLTDDDDGAEAEVVQVTVNARKVFYALTPLVGAFNSGDVIGRALAGQESATCNVAPMFFCVPQSGGNNIADFPRDQDIGRQLRLHVRNSNAETITPGNFGFLDQPFGETNEKNRRLGLNTALAGCFEDSADETTTPGHRTPQGNALNSRMDLFASPIQPNNCDADGDFCPSQNTTKNWVAKIRKNGQNATATCPATPPSNATWVSVSSITDSITAVSNPGYPDDSSFTGILGNGNWSAASWIPIIHSGNTVASVPDVDGNGSISRYETYLWELSDPANLLRPRLVGQTAATGNGNNRRFDVYCSYPQPVQAAGLASSDEQKDRRVLTVAAVACTNGYPNGAKPVRALRWVDLFITKPMNTASDTEFYTEVIGPAKRADGGTGFQYFGRKKAVLIR